MRSLAEIILAIWLFWGGDPPERQEWLEVGRVEHCTGQHQAILQEWQDRYFLNDLCKVRLDMRFVERARCESGSLQVLCKG